MVLTTTCQLSPYHGSKAQALTLSSQKKTGENLPSSFMPLAAPPLLAPLPAGGCSALTCTCLVISVTMERRSIADSSIPPNCKARMREDSHFSAVLQVNQGIGRELVTEPAAKQTTWGTNLNLS